MSNSNRKVILDYLQGTLFPTITVANGYNSTIKLYERGLKSLNEMAPGEFPALFVASADEQRKDISNRRFSSTMTVFIYGVVRFNSSEALQPALDNWIEDTTKALYAGTNPASPDPTHGGKVASTRIISVKTDPGNQQPYGYFEMEVEFLYESAWTTP